MSKKRQKALTPEFKEYPNIHNHEQLSKALKMSSVVPKVPVGTLEGEYWIWPDGRKTHLRFIGIAVSKMRPLPKGFYAAAKKANRINLNLLVTKAQSLKLKDTVTEP